MSTRYIHIYRKSLMTSLFHQQQNYVFYGYFTCFTSASVSDCQQLWWFASRIIPIFLEFSAIKSACMRAKKCIIGWLLCFGGAWRTATIMGIVIGSCVPDDEPETTDRFHHVVYGKTRGKLRIFLPSAPDTRSGHYARIGRKF